jgi:hypothetical protein
MVSLPSALSPDVVCNGFVFRLGRSAPCWNCRVSWPWLLSLVCCLVAFLVSMLYFSYLCNAMQWLWNTVVLVF